MVELDSHDDYRRYKVFRRTFWAVFTAKVIRPYWALNGEVEGYILELRSGLSMAVPKQHIKAEG